MERHIGCRNYLQDQTGALKEVSSIPQNLDLHWHNLLEFRPLSPRESHSWEGFSLLALCYKTTQGECVGQSFTDQSVLQSLDIGVGSGIQEPRAGKAASFWNLLSKNYASKEARAGKAKWNEGAGPQRSVFAEELSEERTQASGIKVLQHSSSEKP